VHFANHLDVDDGILTRALTAMTQILPLHTDAIADTPAIGGQPTPTKSAWSGAEM
jgi:hypothetical protein